MANVSARVIASYQSYFGAEATRGRGLSGVKKVFKASRAKWSARSRYFAAPESRNAAASTAITSPIAPG
jgi:hypothetical protein